ncbi:MAG: glutamine synthetase [Comamonadaceae bacterium]|nr:glutamine synthetase [Comamonadaceae bacterium]
MDTQDAWLSVWSGSQFAPKITVGKAGSGMHFHLLIEKDGKNLLVENSKLSDIAKMAIAGILDLSKALTAFGNTIPTSYLRLVPHQEAPTNICWGDRNRSVLIRVPLGWSGNSEMINDANPADNTIVEQKTSRQTFELRSPDGSADIYCLMAGMVLGIEHGLEMENFFRWLKISMSIIISSGKKTNRTYSLTHCPHHVGNRLRHCWLRGHLLSGMVCSLQV